MGEKISLSYTLRKSKRARHVRIAVYCDGLVVVTAPQRIPQRTIEQFIHERSSWILRTLERFRPFRPRPKRRNTKREFLLLKDAAFSLAKKRVEYFNAVYGLRYNKIFIKNQKTRWGSCSKNRNLSFNFRIAKLPLHLLDYVIVHELCHLKEFNHSKKFWDLVSETIPAYAQYRAELKKVSKQHA